MGKVPGWHHPGGGLGRWLARSGAGRDHFAAARQLGDVRLPVQTPLPPDTPLPPQGFRLEQTGMIPQAELDRFFEQLVATVQAKGAVCAITSGMACVQYGVAQATKDCDLLCAANSAGQLLNVLRATPLHGVSCSYRGHLTPPLDQRWLRGGWTSHFHWDLGETAAYLDVFGVAPRASSEWMTEGAGTLTGMHTVAEMSAPTEPRIGPAQRRWE